MLLTTTNKQTENLRLTETVRRFKCF